MCVCMFEADIIFNGNSYFFYFICYNYLFKLSGATELLKIKLSFVIISEF